MDQVMGIEPIPSPWQGDILPLNYTWMVHLERVELSSDTLEGCCFVH